MAQSDPKEEQARDIALSIAENEDTDVLPRDVKSWHEWDIYEWIEAWGYEWDGDEWQYNGDDEE